MIQPFFLGIGASSLIYFGKYEGAKFPSEFILSLILALKTNFPDFQAQGLGSTNSEVMLTYAIWMIPFMILFFLIHVYGVNIPFSDDWSFVDMIDKFLSETLSFQDLWAHHNEHRPVTMKIVRLLSVELTRWNLVSEMMFSAFVALLTFVMIARRITKTFRILTIEHPMLLIVFSAISLAGFSQYENWMWRIATHWFMANFFAVSSLFLLISPSLGVMRFLLAVISARLSFIFMGQGFLAFFLGIFVLLMRPGDTKRNFADKSFRTLAWIWITIIVAIPYWTNYTKPPHRPSLVLFLE